MGVGLSLCVMDPLQRRNRQMTGRVAGGSCMRGRAQHCEAKDQGIATFSQPLLPCLQKEASYSCVLGLVEIQIRDRLKAL